MKKKTLAHFLKGYIIDKLDLNKCFTSYSRAVYSGIFNFSCRHLSIHLVTATMMLPHTMSSRTSSETDEDGDKDGDRDEDEDKWERVG